MNLPDLPPPGRPDEICAICATLIPYEDIRWVMGDRQVACGRCHEKRRKVRKPS